MRSADRRAQTYPALFNLYRLELLPKGTHIVGYARTKMDKPEFHEKISAHFKDADSGEGAKAKKAFLDICTYQPGAYDKDEAFQELNSAMEKIEKEGGSKNPNRLFYMALPPNVFTVVAAGLKKNCYSEKGHNRIVIEKPFGKDLESSREMMGKLKDLWKEEETFRECQGALRLCGGAMQRAELAADAPRCTGIDHYLGKEMVKNLLVMRFGNPVVDAGLNNKMVDNVQITFKEPFGTEGRGGYFDEFGIIRDIQQNRECAGERGFDGGEPGRAPCSHAPRQTCPRCSRCLPWSSRSPSRPRTSAARRSTC
jgi:glucose-6-phosphate 1-dehydrogenase